MTRRIFCLVLAGLLFPIISLGQQQPDNGANNTQAPIVIVTPPPPVTALESRLAMKNAIVVKGFTDIATVNGEDGAAIRVIAVEASIPPQQDHAYGLAIEIHSQGDHVAVSYVDLDEIDGLISAIDYLTKADATVTQLANYTVQYRTRGDLELSNFATDGSRLIGIKSVQILPTTNQLLFATAYFRVATMGELRQQLIAGQQAIDKIKGPAR